MKLDIRTFYLAFLVFFACNKSDRFFVDPNDVDITVESIRFDKLLGKYDTLNADDKIVQLSSLYPEFFNLYSKEIINIGVLGDLNYTSNFNRFKSDSIYCQVFDSVQAQMDDISTITETLQNGLKRFHYFFPSKDIPDIYYHISGFNESVVVAPKILAISIENYLGSNHSFYKWLALYEYLRINMYPEKIPSDALWAWMTTEFEIEKSNQDLLNSIVYEGKILYLLSKLLPDEPLYRIHSYTEEQLSWCEENEKSMWTYIIEYKHLFSRDVTTIKKYTAPGPFTHFFGTESAPRTGSYIGYKIVSEFMQNNSEISLDALMKISDARIILEKSAYRP